MKYECLIRKQTSCCIISGFIAKEGIKEDGKFFLCINVNLCGAFYNKGKKIDSWEVVVSSVIVCCFRENGERINTALA